MKIIFTSPTDQHRTEVDTEHNVTIMDAYVGPIFVNDGVALAIFARDDGFEMNCWRLPENWQIGEKGGVDHDGALPLEAVMASISPSGVRLLHVSAADR